LKRGSLIKVPDGEPAAYDPFPDAQRPLGGQIVIGFLRLNGFHLDGGLEIDGFTLYMIETASSTK
jgi:hypothetical protein